MLKNLSIKTRMLAGFGAVLFLCLIISLSSVYLLRGIGHEVEDIINLDIPNVEMAGRVADQVNVIARVIRNAIMVEDKKESLKELERVTEATRVVVETLDKLEKRAKTDKERGLIADIKTKRAAYRSDLDKVMALIRDDKKKEASSFIITTLRTTQGAYFAALNAYIKQENENALRSGNEALEAVKRGQIITFAILGVTIVLAIAASLLITRSVTGPLAEGVSAAERLAAGDLTASVTVRRNDEVGRLMTAMDVMVKSLRELVGKIKIAADNLASGSGQLSAGAEEISRNMDDQSSRSSQIATATEEMSQTVIDVAKNTSTIAEISGETFRQAQDGESVVQRSVQEVQAIASTVAESSEVMQRLGSSSKEIGNIVDVINDIADQTNLLALNAAIEAARAGEQGRGFAVVADEVRKLAERTSQATAQISTMIRAIQGEVGNAVASMNSATARVESGVDFSRKAGDSLGNIVRSVSSLQSMVQQIASATEEMSSVSETISSDIQNIAEGSKEVSSGGEQIARSSSDLARLATELQTMVGKFKV